ncbi:MAG TPA: diaminobutyrate acetyltransferase [Rhizorhapis sp.]
MPKAEDGAAISKLIAACPPLDRNSAYCNLLQCSHFADTCIVAERDGYIAGWISGYRPPSEPDRFFIWQVAVSETARGAGLAGRMIDMLLARPSAAGARALITTITPENAASWALFEGYARRRGLSFGKAPKFERERHFGGAHETEWEVSIGLPPAASAA